jgi:hypothetical protein
VINAFMLLLVSEMVPGLVISGFAPLFRRDPHQPHELDSQYLRERGRQGRLYQTVNKNDDQGARR